MAEARRYRGTPARRLADRWFAWLTRRGWGAAYRHLLTVRGRRTGLPRTTPVDVMEVGGERWLVAPYGEVEWVRNARVAGEVELARGGRSVRYRAEEVDPETAAPVIGSYIGRVPITRSWWGVGPDADHEQLVAEAATHPVFRLIAT
jgi:deazaflavin-dependent oxidoreductase (nitroreductase family)